MLSVKHESRLERVGNEVDIIISANKNLMNKQTQKVASSFYRIVKTTFSFFNRNRISVCIFKRNQLECIPCYTLMCRFSDALLLEQFFSAAVQPQSATDTFDRRISAVESIFTLLSQKVTKATKVFPFCEIKKFIFANMSKKNFMVHQRADTSMYNKIYFLITTIVPQSPFRILKIL